ncbi:MAG TPA: transcriptional regulator, partial [Cyanothece sp. UBA12306]|nr:transcriptional regulator [Cyanothece sp. UBA12306]
METTKIPAPPTIELPDHTQLPDRDNNFVKNFQEHPQSILLTETITPILEAKHEDHYYCIGQDSGIYWKLTDPIERGVVAPDWFYVPNVPPSLDGKPRRSYVLWQEIISPLIVIEFVSGDGKEERDKTPWKGKFWIYETVIHAGYYAIYEVESARVEVYQLLANHYQLMDSNERGHYPIPEIGVELGIWTGTYQNLELPWLRWWDSQGNLLLMGNELAIQEREAKELAEQMAI